MKNERGITLIALVITIIVLLILAGVSISLVVGNNSIITRANQATLETRKGNAKDQVAMAWDSVETEYLVEHSKNLSKQRGEFFNESMLNTYLGEGTISNLHYNEGGKSTLTYTNGNDVFEMEIDGTGKVGVVSTGGNTQSPTDERFLADVAEIGDYVDIGIPYINVVADFFSEHTTTDIPLTGWRVLSKEGGKVKLVSAGCPLTYVWNQEDLSTDAITYLEDLYTTIQLRSEDNEQGFGKSGFGGSVINTGTQDLTNLFNSCQYIETQEHDGDNNWKDIHALGCSTNGFGETGIISTKYTELNEVEKLYEKITGQKKEMKDLWAMNWLDEECYFKNDIIKIAYPSSWKNSYADLLCIGQGYILGGCANCDVGLWGVNVNGTIGNSEECLGDQWGVRVVITLKDGIKIAEDNIADGSSSDNTYKLTLN